MLLVDEAMVCDPGWQAWVARALAAAGEDVAGAHQILPLAFTPAATALFREGPAIQLEQLFRHPPGNWRRSATIAVTHGCARLLLTPEPTPRRKRPTEGARARTSGGQEPREPPAPVNLF